MYFFKHLALARVHNLSLSNYLAVKVMYRERALIVSVNVKSPASLFLNRLAMVLWLRARLFSGKFLRTFTKHF